MAKVGRLSTSGVMARKTSSAPMPSTNRTVTRRRRCALVANASALALAEDNVR